MKTWPVFMCRKPQYLVKTSIYCLSKWSYNFNTMSVNSPAGFSIEIEKIIQNSCLNTKGLK